MAKRFIVIDGTDGSGKGTQTALLEKRLKQARVPLKIVDFPQYGKPSAYFVERYLNGKYGGLEDVGAKEASLFFALDRYDAKLPMLKHLEQGKVLLSNRYITSNMGHQTAKIRSKNARTAFLDWIEETEYGILGLPRPTLQLILCMPAEVSQQLVDKKGKRGYTTKKRDLHEASLQHLRDAERAYRELAGRDKTFHLIECVQNGELRTREDIQEEIWKLVVRHLKASVPTSANLKIAA